MVLRNRIIDCMRDIAELSRSKLIEPLEDETVLLQSGLDSLGFATLVARLEEDLGFDPFTMSDEPVYPRTLGEFVNFYESMSLRKK